MQGPQLPGVKGLVVSTAQSLSPVCVFRRQVIAHPQVYFYIHCDRPKYIGKKSSIILGTGRHIKVTVKQLLLHW